MDKYNGDEWCILVVVVFLGLLLLMLAAEGLVVYLRYLNRKRMKR